MPPTDPLSTELTDTTPIQTESSIPSWLQIPQTSVEISDSPDVQTSSEDQQISNKQEFSIPATDPLNEVTDIAK
jgi:hypothetical protein